MSGHPPDELENLVQAALCLRRIRPQLDKDMVDRLAQIMDAFHKILPTGPTNATNATELGKLISTAQGTSQDVLGSSSLTIRSANEGGQPTQEISTSPQAGPSTNNNSKRTNSALHSSSAEEESSDEEVSDESDSEQQIDTREFPNGDVLFMDKIVSGSKAIETRSVGWAMGQYSRDRNSIYKVCVGVYQCPVPGCRRIERPRLIPGGTSKTNPIAQPPKQPCPWHEVPLVQVQCHATLKSKRDGKDIFFEHRGFHNHRKPNDIRAESKSKKRRKAEIAAKDNNSSSRSSSARPGLGLGGDISSLASLKRIAGGSEGDGNGNGGDAELTNRPVQDATVESRALDEVTTRPPQTNVAFTIEGDRTPIEGSNVKNRNNNEEDRAVTEEDDIMGFEEDEEEERLASQREGLQSTTSTQSFGETLLHPQGSTIVPPMVNTFSSTTKPQEVNTFSNTTPQVVNSNTVPQGMNAFRNTVPQGMNAFRNTASQGMNTLGNTAPERVNTFSNTTPQGVNTFGNTVPQGVNTFSNTLPQGVNTFINTVPQGVNNFSHNTPQVVNTFSNTAPQGVNTLSNTVPQGVNNTTNTALQVVNTIRSDGLGTTTSPGLGFYFEKLMATTPGNLPHCAACKAMNEPDERSLIEPGDMRFVLTQIVPGSAGPRIMTESFHPTLFCTNRLPEPFRSEARTTL
ncbi:hypothetical protein BG004_007965, partial [Podila humilis]